MSAPRPLEPAGLLILSSLTPAAVTPAAVTPAAVTPAGLPPEPARAAGARLAPGPARERERDDGGDAPRGGAWDLFAADMNGDRRLDLVIATGGPGDPRGAIEVRLSPAEPAPLEAWPRVVLEARADYGRVAVGDIDGDGDNDVAALTFGSRLLRWWLLDRELGVEAERSMDFGGPAPGSCPGPALGGASPQTLSSLAFADLDVDGRLELAVTSYASGDTGRAFSFTFDPASRCFRSRPGFPQATRGSLRVRFVDVDDDGALDMVASHYALAGAPERGLSGGKRAGAPGALEWGSWWRSASGQPRPLEARVELRELTEAAPTPELNVVDFDALYGRAGVRFALAGSAHLCPAADCWSAGAAGLVAVVDAAGRQVYLGQGWKRRAEQSPPLAEARLLPRSVSFRASSHAPSLIAGYWWATRHKASACSRIEPCAGPLVRIDLAGGARAAPDAAAPPGGVSADHAGGQQPDLLEPAAFVQALALLEAHGGVPQRKRTCSAARSLIVLPDAPVSAVLGVELGGRAVPSSAWSWAPGSAAVSLAARVKAHGLACVDYLASAAAQLAIADSRAGVSLVPL